MALDHEEHLVNDVSFREHLSNRFEDQRLQTQLKAFTERFQATVILLDLAEHQEAGASTREIRLYKILTKPQLILPACLN